MTRAGTGAPGLWKLRSKHIIWGIPRQKDNRHNVTYPGESEARPGISVLVREGFVLGHYDLFREPAWVSVRWNREDYENLTSTSFGRPFGPDSELPRYAQADDDYQNSTSHMERGHMARHEDNEAWGKDNSDAGCLMSNIVPQHEDMNGEAWNDLEDMHQEIVKSGPIDTVWIISGPIFEGDQPVSMIGNGVAVPQATYKIIGWFGTDETFNARGYVVRQEDRIRNNPAHYLRRIREIEDATGLDFFPELPPDRANAIETATPTNLWDEIGGEPPAPPGAATVLIESLLPDPPGNESVNEAVTVRNHGTSAVILDGWLLEDASGKTWSLSGTIDAGDERKFQRNGQAMAMNNNGDTIRLLRPDRSVADSVPYESATEGQWLRAEDLR